MFIGISVGIKKYNSCIRNIVVGICLQINKSPEIFAIGDLNVWKKLYYDASNLFQRIPEEAIERDIHLFTKLASTIVHTKLKGNNNQRDNYKRKAPISHSYYDTKPFLNKRYLC